nr:MAG TPA: hypothetical protein [Caudoviricetes sp.]
MTALPGHESPSERLLIPLTGMKRPRPPLRWAGPLGGTSVQSGRGASKCRTMAAITSAISPATSRPGRSRPVRRATICPSSTRKRAWSGLCSLMRPIWPVRHSSTRTRPREAEAAAATTFIWSVSWSAVEGVGAVVWVTVGSWAVRWSVGCWAVRESIMARAYAGIRAECKPAGEVAESGG